MSEENNAVSAGEANENSFVVDEDEFFNTTTPPASADEEKKVEPEATKVAEPDNEEAETQDDDDTVATEEDTEEDKADEAPKPKVNKTQERIKELNANWRQEQRARQELEKRLNDIEAERKQTPAAPKAEDNHPRPDELNADGSEKYPLGEYDPTYLAAVVKHNFAVEREASLKQMEADKIEFTRQAQKTELLSDWNTKVAPAQERYPDFQEKSEDLVDLIESSIPKDYSDYLSETLMRMENGPDVLYYLANNPDEAVKLITSGATLATIGLGRLDAKFAIANEEKSKARPKVSNAPAPPPTNKGAAVSVGIDPNTDNLDDFSLVFYDKKKK